MAINFLNITETLVEARINDNTVGSNLPTPRLAFKENGVVSGGISTTGGNLILETSSGTERVRITSTGNSIFSGDVTLIDNKKLQLGTSGNFNMFFDGSKTTLQNFTGSFNIVQKANDGNIVFTNDDGNGGTFDYFVVDGGSATYSGGATTAVFTVWQDKSRIALGSGKDLQIYHDGSNSYINESGTGSLITQTSAYFLRQGGTNNTNNAIVANTSVALYNAGTKRLETTSTGVTVTGGIVFGDNHFIGNGTGDDLSIQSSAGEDIVLDASGDIVLDAGDNDIRLKAAGTEFGKLSKGVGSDFVINSSIDDKDIIFTGLDGGSAITALTLDMSDAGAAEFGARVYIPEYIAHVGDSNTLFGFSGNDTFVVNTNGSERFRINNSGFVGIGSNSPVAPLEVKSSETNHLTLYRPTNTTEGIAGNINFDGNDSDTNQQTYAKISSFTDDPTAGSIAGKLSFSIAKGGDGMTSAMTIQKDAQVSLNQYGSGSYTGTAAYTLQVDSAGNIIEGSTSGGGTVTGSGTATRVAFWSGTTALSSDANLYWDNTNDRLGIGTSTPTFPLEVNGGTGDGVKIKAGNSSNDDSFLVADNADSTLFLVDGAGNVGIGTTSLNETLSLYKSDRPYIQFISNTTGTTSSDGSFIGFANADGFLEIRNKEAQPIRLSTSDTERMRITSAGKVGIGTTSPASKLHIYQNTSDTSSSAGLTIEQDGAGDAVVQYLLTGNRRWVAGVDNSDSDRFKFASSANVGTDTVVTINTAEAGGNVGIGTTSPAVELDVAGTVRSTSSSTKYAQLESNSSGGVVKGVGGNGFLVRSYGDSYFNGGDFGIGTTSPGAKLEVVGDSRIYDSLNVGYRSVTSSTTNYQSTLILSGKNNYSDGTTWYGSYGQLLLSSDSNMTSSARRFLITNALDNNKFAIVRSANATTDPVVNSTANGINSGTADFVIDNAGKIGIGTTSPDRKLEVDFTGSVVGARFTRSDAAGSSTIEFANSGGVKNIIGYDAGVDGFKIGSSSATNVVVKNNGNVGIGTTAPAYKLEVSGGAISIKGHAPGNSLRLDSTDGTTSTSRNALYVDTSNVFQIGNTNYTSNNIIGNTTFSGDVGLADNKKLKFGAGPDLEIYHNSTTNVNHISSLLSRQLSINADATTFSGDVNVQDNLYLQDGSTVRAKIQLNASDRDDLDIIAASLGSKMKFFTVGAERMRIDSAGNVGIGATSPSSRLQIGLSGSLGAVTNKNINATFDGGYSTSNSLQYQVNSHVGTTTDTSDIFTQTSGESLKNFYEGIVADGGYFNANRYSIIQGGAERFTIKQGGNVGIGTTTPAEKLEVAGSIKSTSRAISGSSTAGVTLSYDTANSIAKIETWTSKPFSIETAGVERMRITSTGNLGIGTTAPANKLSVNLTSSVALANQPAVPLFVSNGGNSVDGRVFIDVKHDSINTASAIGAGLRMQAGAVTTGTASYNSSLIFLQSAGPGSNTIHSAPKAIQFYVDNHDTAAGSGTNYGQYGDLAMTIAENTNVGIGTTSPGAKLEVVGELKATRFTMNPNYDASNLYFVLNKKQTNDGGIILTSKTSAGATQNDWQIVNSGTAADLKFYAYGLAGNSLTLDRENGNATFAGAITVTDSTSGVLVDSAGHASFRLDRGSTSYDNNLIFSTAGDHKFRLWQDGNADYLYIRDDDNATNMVTFKKGGNVGIGNTNPSSLLHLSSASSPTLRIVDTTNNVTLLAFAQDSSAGFGTYSNHTLAFFTNSAERMRISTGGTVGIGTTSPGSVNGTAFGGVMLHVKGPGNIGRLVLEGSVQGTMLMNATGSSANQRLKFIQSKQGEFRMGKVSDSGTETTQLAIDDGGDVILQAPGKGLVLVAPNGTSYRLSVTNDGELQTEVV